MKKATILLSFLAITFLACKNPLKLSSEAEPSNFEKADSIPNAVALNMIAHYLDTVVDHSLNAINKQASLYNSDLNKIFKLDNITRIKLLAAAYLSTDTVVARRNMPTVLVQLKQGYHSNYYYYDIQSFGSGRLCPPPNGCSTAIQN
jgi:hypothetical protein